MEAFRYSSIGNVNSVESERARAEKKKMPDTAALRRKETRIDYANERKLDFFFTQSLGGKVDVSMYIPVSFHVEHEQRVSFRARFLVRYIAQPQQLGRVRFVIKIRNEEQAGVFIFD